MKVLGIDPGVSGGLGLLRNGRVESVFPMPVYSAGGSKRRVDAYALAALVREIAPEQAFVELVGSRPGEGHAGAFAFGRSLGALEGVLAGCGVPSTLVTPAQWKVELKVPADKNAARARASQLFPGAARLWPLVKDDGKAEACLIALWGFRRLGGGQFVEW